MLKSVWKAFGRIIPSLCNDQPFLRSINLACACRLEGAQWKLVQVFPLHRLLHLRSSIITNSPGKHKKAFGEKFHQDQKALQLNHILALDAQVVSRFNESGNNESLRSSKCLQVSKFLNTFLVPYGRLALPNHSSEKVGHIILDWILHTSLVRQIGQHDEHLNTRSPRL